MRRADGYPFDDIIYGFSKGWEVKRVIILNGRIYMKGYIFTPQHMYILCDKDLGVWE